MENENKLIVIDPGHSDDDLGATYDDIDEKDLNLVIANLVHSQLVNYNYNVHLTRYDDLKLDLSTRCKIANSMNADLFVSIHHNASKIESAIGYEVIYYTNSEEGCKLSTLILDQFKDKLDMVDRGLKERCNLYVLKNTDMVACLVECGFMSNPDELKLINNPKNQIKIARCITEDIIKYITK